MKLLQSRLFQSAPFKLALAALVALTLSTGSLQAQSSSSVGSIHGHVQDPLGVPIADGIVKLTQDTGAIDKGSRYEYSFNTDATGDYKGTGITAGTYHAVLFRQGATVDYIESVVFTAGADTKADFDLSRQAYIDKMNPEERKTYEEYKKKTSASNAENAQIKNLNAILGEARTDMDPAKTNPPNYDRAVTLMLQATQARPLEPVLWFELGHAYLGSKKYDQAVPALQKSIELGNSAKKSSPETLGTAYNSLGEAYANQGKVSEASAAYETAAKANPPSAGMYYGNEAITLYKAGTTDMTNQATDFAGAAAAADKAVAANPKNAIAYYVKGQSLVGQTTSDASGKIIAPPGCLEAYQMYLQVAPDGPFAGEVKQILAGFGQTLTKSYKAR